MIPAPFRYVKPESVDEAIAYLAQHGSDARVLAGGQSLLVLLKARTIAPRVLIDIGGVRDLRGISRQGNSIRIGALATQAELAESEELRSAFPLFSGDASRLSDPIVRKRGTFVGALAFADPAGDWPAIALVLDAQPHVRSVNGRRTISIHDFFRDSFATALQPTDLLTHVVIEVPQGQPKMVYRKLRHPTSGYALVGAAAALEHDPEGICSDCRVAVTGAGRRVVRAKAVEVALRGQHLGPTIIAQAAERAAEGIDLARDLYAGPAYRALLARTYVKRALLEGASALH